MTGKAGFQPALIPIVAGVLAVGLIAIPVMLPKGDTDTVSTSEAIVSDPAAQESTPAADDAISAATPAPSAPEENSVPAGSTTADQEAAVSDLEAALSAYENKLSEAGGVQGSFISAASQEMLFSLSPNGDYRAVTTDPNAPEWLFVNPVLYARLGEMELNAQREALDAIGKSEAVWTDAATNGREQGVFLSAGNIANAVADLLPLMDDVFASDGPDGTVVIQGSIDLAGDLGFNAQAYNLKPVDRPDAPETVRLASVAFTIDKSGILQGYIVQPPDGSQPVSLLLTKFSKVTIKRPGPARVITLKDLAPILDNNPSPSPSPSASTP